MAKAYTFEELMKRNEKIANTPAGELFKDTNGDAAQGEILDVPSQTRDQAAAAASAAAQAAAKALYTSGSQYKTPQTLIPGMSYTDWLIKGGMNGQAQKEYDAAVRAAETDYAKTLAIYGQNAETLGRAGLTGSGYTDYLTGAAFSAMQGAKVAAADTKALTETQQRLSYADYLAGVDAQNAQLAAQEIAKQEALAAEQEATAASIKGTIDQYMQQGMDDKAIMAMIQQHYGNQFDQYLGGWIANAHTYNDPLVAQQQTAQTDEVSAKYRQEIYDRLIAGTDPAAVRADIEYAMKLAGVDTSQLDAWMAEAQTAAQPTIDANNKAKTEAENAEANAEALNRRQAAIVDYEKYANENGGEYAKLMMRELGYTEDEIATAATVIQGLTTATQSTLINLDGLTVDQLPTAASINNEVTLGRMSAEDGEKLKAQVAKKRAELLKQQLEELADSDSETVNADAEALFKQIDKLDKADLSDEGRSELYALRAEAYLNTAVEGNEPVADMIQAYIALGLDEDDANEAAAEGFMSSIVGNIEVLGVNASSGAALTGVDAGITIKIGEKKNGKDATEIIEVTYRNKALTDQEKTALGDGETGDIKKHNGTLYIKSAYGWRAVKKVVNKSVGGKENAAIMYNILLDYYS